MKKYEYKVIHDMTSLCEEVTEKTRERILDAHGAEGWELCAVTVSTVPIKGECFIYYFKRQLS